MPTYEYVCAKCGHRFEQFQSIADPPLRTCPRELCIRKPWGKGKVRRVIGAGAGLLFKGSGFYITDYRSEGYKQAAKQEAPGATSVSGESKPSSGAKPAGAKPPTAKPAAAPSTS